MGKVIIKNCKTGEITERDMTPEELERAEAKAATLPIPSRTNEIKARLDVLDTASIRSISAIVANKKSDDDVARLEAIETEKAALRVELAALS